MRKVNVKYHAKRTSAKHNCIKRKKDVADKNIKAHLRNIDVNVLFE